MSSAAMNEEPIPETNPKPIHHLYLHFQELPISRRVLYTGVLLVLGLGYIFGLLYVYAAHAGLDGKPGLSVDDIVIAYSGSTEGTRLETALRGPMRNMVGQADLVSMLGWVQAGAGRGSYEAQIKPIIDKNCLGCHDGSNPHLTNLDGFDNIQTVVEMDTGPDMFTLVRVSHIHLFGITFIFFLMGLIFSHAFLRPVWFKALIMGMPFACIVSDVSSWYFTKLVSGFAWVVLISGALMGLSFAAMWIVSMWQIWFYTVPDWVAQREISGQRRIG
jgi:hypothetical protein